MAAAYAYRGHWKAAKNPEERESIRKIEEDEWHHRDLLGQMLGELGAKPKRFLEIKMRLIGKSIGLLCYVTGWFFPMYGAGRLESKNVLEYLYAARYAVNAGHGAFVEELLVMSEVEWDHELYFREKVIGHRLLRVFPLWTVPGPRDSIRKMLNAS